MRTFGHILFGILLISASIFLESYIPKNTKDRTVLNNFILGVDNSSTLSKKIQLDELNVEFEYDGIVEITKITSDHYLYRGSLCKVSLLLINDNLYAIQYYPKNDNRSEKLSAKKVDLPKEDIINKDEKPISEVNFQDKF